MPIHTPLHIATAAKSGAKAASPEQKRFQTLLTRIQAARERLQAWQQQLPLFAQMHAERVAPQAKALMASRRDFAFELETLLGAQRWSRADAETLAETICDIAGGLLDAGGEADEALKALYNRHAAVDFDTEGQQDLAAMKSMFETFGGLDLGDEPVESMEELVQRAHEKAAAQRPPADAPPARKRRKQKSAAEKRAEEDAQRISQTVREVYRKLASALHPDRLPAELPAAEREARTGLMQRANSAYEAGDLLALLELQLQIEQVDIAHAANVAAEQLRHFNRVLAEQLRELEMEIDGRQHAFCATYGMLPERRLDPHKLGLLLKDELHEIAAAQALLDHDRRALRGAPAQARRLLKQWRAEQRESGFDLPF